MPDPPEFPSPEKPARRRSPARPGSTEEALQRLEERLDRASRAAERLIAEAAEAAARGGAAGGTGGTGGGGAAVGAGAAGGGDPSGNPGPASGEPDAEEPPAPPASGWQIPEDSAASDLDPFVTLVRALRDLIPAELQRRLAAALRELLLALRALIDWYLERLERRREQAVEVQDIPIF
ncbi:MAG: hypothetical protein ACLPY3_27345 [Solirubrobacteraceae bacterium]